MSEKKALSRIEVVMANEVLPWMKQHDISRVTMDCHGGGDEGQRADWQFYRGDDALDGDPEGAQRILDVLENACSDLAPWQWIDGNGGSVYMTLHADGRYQMDGAIMSAVDTPTFFGSLTDVPPDTIKEPEIEKGFAVVQEGGTSCEKYLHVSDTLEAAEAFRISCRDDGAYNTSPVFEVPAAVMRLSGADRQDIFSWVEELLQARLGMPES